MAYARYSIYMLLRVIIVVETSSNNKAIEKHSQNIKLRQATILNFVERHLGLFLAESTCVKMPNFVKVS